MSTEQIDGKRGPGRPPAAPKDDLAAAILLLAERLGGNQEKLVETLEALKASQPVKDVNFGDTDYQARLRATTSTLRRPAFQNGFEVNPSGLSDEVLDRLAQLQPGTYLGGVVRVAVDGQDAIHLIYKNKTVEQRFANERLFGSFSALVNTIWAEQGAA